MELSKHRILLTGGGGFLGHAVQRCLEQRGVRHVFVPRKTNYDLTREAEVIRLYADSRPEVVIHLAAEVGGIGANMRNPGRYFYANMAMALHLIEHGRLAGVQKFVQAGTICAYPNHTPIPFREDALWDGYPEPTNAPYGVAKKAALVMLDAYARQYGMRSAYVLPVNLYGPRDNFDPESSHVIPALIRKCVEARESGASAIECWGTGAASREFLHVDDCAEGVVRAAEVMEDPTPVNLGTGHEITIAALTGLIARLSGFDGQIRWDHSRPDGQTRRCLDTSRARELLKWTAQIDFEAGLRETIAWFESNREGRQAV